MRTSCELYRTCLLCSAVPFPLHLCFPPGVLLEFHRKSGQKNPRFLPFVGPKTSQAADVQARPLQQPGAPLTFLRFKPSNDESCTGPDEHIGKIPKIPHSGQNSTSASSRTTSSSTSSSTPPGGQIPACTRSNPHPAPVRVTAIREQKLPDPSDSTATTSVINEGGSSLQTRDFAAEADSPRQSGGRRHGV